MERGKALAASRTGLDELLKREEMGQSGVYVLTGSDPETGKPMAYVGEAEILRDRLKSHKTKDFWVSAITFLSKDENLTKSHIRFLEGRVLDESKAAGRFTLDNSTASGAKLPEADRHDMEEFLDQRTPTGFVVFKGSHAVAAHRPTAPQYAPFVVSTRDTFVKDGTLKKEGDRLVFTRDVEFSSPSAAAAVVHGGTANGLTAWKDKAGRTLKEIEDG